MTYLQGYVDTVTGETIYVDHFEVLTPPHVHVRREPPPHIVHRCCRCGHEAVYRLASARCERCNSVYVELMT